MDSGLTLGGILVWIVVFVVVGVGGFAVRMFLANLGRKIERTAIDMANQRAHPAAPTASQTKQAPIIQPVSPPPPPPSPAPAAPRADNLEAVLVDVGDLKISVIKELRDLNPGLSLAQAKHAAETPNYSIAAGLKRADAEAIVRRFAAVGARVELR